MGPRRALTVALPWLVRRRYVFAGLDLSGARLPEPPEVSGLNRECLGEEQLVQASRLHPGMTEREVRRRWDEGQTCHTAWIEERLVHFLWITAAPVWLGFADLRLRLLPGDVYYDFAYTHPAFRRQAIHTAMEAATLAELRALGFARALGAWAPWNLPVARVAGDKMGRRPLGVLDIVCLGPWRRYRVSGAVRLDGSELRIERQGAPPG
jgi:GNAT superfamily N-acetyltransferase